MLNTICLVGRLTDNPQYTATDSGKSVSRFTLACQRDFGTKETDFINCVAWKQTAEFITRHFTKGGMMCVVGRLQINKWEKDGQKRTAPEIVVDSAYFYGASAKQDAPVPSDSPIYPAIDADDAECPF